MVLLCLFRPYMVRIYEWLNKPANRYIFFNPETNIIERNLKRLAVFELPKVQTDLTLRIHLFYLFTIDIQ